MSNMNLNIRSLLESCGFGVYSVRKQKRMVGGQRYNFHGGLLQGFCKGTPDWFYRIELKSETLTGDGVEDYKLAAIILKDAGYTTAQYGWRGQNKGLTVTITEDKS